MTVLPEHFLAEYRAIATRMEGRKRHLFLVGNEGLYVLDRWRAERHFADRRADKTENYL